MNETWKKEGQSPQQSGESNAATLEQAMPPSVSRDQRLQLIGTFQARALQRSEPLAANLDVISGDLMLFAFRIREMMERDMASGLLTEAACQKFERQADTYLKFIRQVDRLAQIERQFVPSAKGRPDSQ